MIQALPEIFSEAIQNGDIHGDVILRRESKTSECGCGPCATCDAVDKAAEQTNTDPTEAQRQAGNYAKGRVRLHGLVIAIENPKGSTRSGIDTDGNEWSVKMRSHYGHILGTKGHDGDPVDVFIGPWPDSELVTVIDQVDADGEFDEHKVMLGWLSREAAVDAYAANYEDGWKVGPAHSMHLDEFKAWLEAGGPSKPFGDAPALETLAAERWVTLGGGDCDDGKGEHCGGRPAQIDDDTGEVTKGPAWAKKAMGGKKASSSTTEEKPTKPEPPKAQASTPTPKPSPPSPVSADNFDQQGRYDANLAAFLRTGSQDPNETARHFRQEGGHDAEWEAAASAGLKKAVDSGDHDSLMTAIASLRQHKDVAGLKSAMGVSDEDVASQLQAAAKAASKASEKTVLVGNEARAHVAKMFGGEKRPADVAYDITYKALQDHGEGSQEYANLLRDRLKGATHEEAAKVAQHGIDAKGNLADLQQRLGVSPAQSKAQPSQPEAQPVPIPAVTREAKKARKKQQPQAAPAPQAAVAPAPQQQPQRPAVPQTPPSPPPAAQKPVGNMTSVPKPEPQPQQAQPQPQPQDQQKAIDAIWQRAAQGDAKALQSVQIAKRAKFVDRAEGLANLSPEQRAHYTESMHAALERVPLGVSRHLLKAASAVRFHADHDGVTADYYRSANLGSDPQVSAGKGRAAGFVNMRTGEIVLDGGGERRQTSLNGKLVNTAEQVYLHELSHLLDRSDKASGTAEWQAAWRAEMGGGQLNRYAASHPAEGFAEFARLAWTDAEAAQRHFPKAYAFWQQRGYVQ